MTTNTPNNGIPFVPENTLDPAAGLNNSLVVIDVLLQLRVVDLGVNTPPASPVDGDRYIVGPAPTGTWQFQANRLAQYVASGNFWRYYDAFIALNNADGKLYSYTDGGGWAPIMGEGGVTTLNGLSNVNTTGVDQGYMLVYDVDSSIWFVQPTPAPGLPEAPQDGRVYGRQNGQWVEVTAGDGSGGTPEWDGVYYVADSYGIARALNGVDPNDVIQMWDNKSEYNWGYQFAISTPTQIAAITARDEIYIINKNNGALDKMFAPPNVTGNAWPYGAVSDGGSKLYVIYDDGFVRKYDVAAETQDWEFALPHGQPGSAIARDPTTDNIVVTTFHVTVGETFLVVIDSAGNQVATSEVFSQGQNANGVAVGDDGAIYVMFTGFSDGFVRKYDMTDATLQTALWERTTGQQAGGGRMAAVAPDGRSFWNDENSNGDMTIVAADGLSHIRQPAYTASDVGITPDGENYYYQDTSGNLTVVSLATDAVVFTHHIADGGVTAGMSSVTF